MSLAELNTLYTAAVTALAARDYDGAIANAMAIQARLATTPNVTRSLAGGGSQALSFNPAQLDSFIANCRQLKASAAHASSGPFRSCKVTYVRPNSVSDF